VRSPMHVKHQKLILAVHANGHLPHHLNRRQCAEYNECRRYQPAKAAGKPVFVVEYNAAAFARACACQGTFGMTTILKVTTDYEAGSRYRPQGGDRALPKPTLPALIPSRFITPSPQPQPQPQPHHTVALHLPTPQDLALKLGQVTCPTTTAPCSLRV
jgi:hypothetical protein